MRVELSGNREGQLQWRLSLFGRMSHLMWSSEHFSAVERTAVYHMCGGGHLFLKKVLAAGAPALNWEATRTDVLATVGAIAAGKSNLMLRTLRQPLTVGGLMVRDHTPVSHYEAHWLEEVPMNLLVSGYNRMLADGLPIGPTIIQSMQPVEILDRIGNGVLGQILKIHEILLQGRVGPGGEPEKVRTDWGQHIRQPVIRRFSIGGERVMLGVADMPGEQFSGGGGASSRGDGDHENDERLRTLGNYGSLVWVIDPAVCSRFRSFLPNDPDASMRPEANMDLRGAQTTRQTVQAKLAERLGEAGGHMLRNIHPEVRLNFCVSKADLVHEALRRGTRLHSMGWTGPGEWTAGREATSRVVEGAMEYLVAMTRRVTKGFITDQRIGGELVEPLMAVWGRDEQFQELAHRVAMALISHYSEPDAFWNLVHEGFSDRIEVPPGVFHNQPGLTLTVPSLDEHIVAALAPGRGGVLHARDLVMSAVACGVCFGLGYRENIRVLFNDPNNWRDPRFHLCSPLVHVPEKMAADRIRPTGVNAQFPDIQERSAALSQLLISLLRGVRS